jgi:hypothetical protein
MSSLQDLVFNLEEGPLRNVLVKVALVLLTTGLVIWLGISQFNGLRTSEAMDLAQQARQIATGHGLTTQVIRPLALWQVRAKFGNNAPSVSQFPETLSPPLYPVILAVVFKLGDISKLVPLGVSPEAIKSMRVYPPDYLVLVFNLLCVGLAAWAVYLWGSGQFDVGTGFLAAVFFLGSTALWNQAISGGSVCLLILLYAWSGYFFYLGLKGEDDSEEASPLGGRWFCLAGFTIGLTPLVQMIHIWPALALVCLGTVLFQKGKRCLVFGFSIPFVLFLGWLGWLWTTTRNPIGINWAYLISESAHYPGDMVWRTYSFDIEKTNVWQRIIGSVVRGAAFLISQGPVLCGATVAGTLAVLSALHSFRRPSAAIAKLLWLGGVGALLLATAFIVRDESGRLSPVPLVILPLACVYGSAALFIIVDRWNLQIDLLGKIFVILVALIASAPIFSFVMQSSAPPFSYPPTYPPIFLFMRSWFEPKEFQASDLPAAEAWYSNQPTLWVPVTRDELIKIHDRVTPIFSILFTPASSDVKMYSQILAENSEWSSWADVIRRQKAPDLPQSFVTSLPPNNEYLLLSLQKRWN